MLASLRLLWYSYSRQHRRVFLFFCFSLLLVATSASIRHLLVINPTPHPQPGPNQSALALPGGFEKMTPPAKSPPFFTLTPQSKAEFGVRPNETLQLTARIPVTAAFVSSHLKTNVPVSLKEISPTQYELQPRSGLAPNQLLNISLETKSASVSGYLFDRNYGWTFQALPRLEVLATLPKNQSTLVPTTTGIEIIFNRDDFTDPQPLISVSPRFEFRTETRGATFVLIPLQPLANSTVYTINLQPGLTTHSQDSRINSPVSFSFQTEPPRSGHPQPVLQIRRNFLQVSPSESPLVEVYTSNWQPDSPLTVEVFQFPSAQLFLFSRSHLDKSTDSWPTLSPVNAKPTSTAGLSKVLSASVKLASHPGPDGYHHTETVPIPQPLPPGFYLIRLLYAENQVAEAWLQSTPVSAYISVGRFQTLIWVNDLSTSTPIADADVHLLDTSLRTTTSPSGISLFDTPPPLFQPGQHYFQITSPSNHQLLLPVTSLAHQPPPSTPTAEDYWSYLYQERTLYRSTDTVHFWGVIKNRDTNQPPPNLKVKITQEYSQFTILETPVTVNPGGSFFGRLQFSHLPEGWYRLSLETNHLTVSSRSFQVIQYQKPDISYTITSHPKAIFAGESVNFSIAARFFDNTPVKNLTLKTYLHEKFGPEIITDSSGIASYSLETKYVDSEVYPRYESIGFLPAQAQTAEPTHEYGSVLIYGSRVLIDSSSSQSGNRASMTATVYQVDLSGINAGTTDNPQGAPAPNTKVELSLTQLWSERVQTGTYYDFFEKVTRPRYSYTPREKVISSTSLTTDSNGRVNYSFTMEPEKSYHLKVSAIDAQGRPATTRHYYHYPPQDHPSHPNSFSPPELVLNKQENAYSMGELVKASLHRDNQPLTNQPNNSYLFLIVNRGRQEFLLSSSPEISFPFTEKHLPNATVAAVIFNGKHYQSAQGNCQWYWQCYYDFTEHYLPGVTIHYDTSANLLELSVSTSPPSAKPGNQVKASVKVTKSGQPVPNASVNLVLVDKALSAIGGVVKPTLTSSLYRHISNQIYYHHSSHRPLIPQPHEAEKGGGGTGVRDLFKDTAFFGSSPTNANGVAEFSFPLPDNITTWLIYSQAVDSNLHTGQAESHLVSTQDFFVTTYFPSHLLASDRPLLFASAFGAALNNNSSINYDLRLLRDKSELVKLTATGRAFSQVSFSPPNLPAGSYRLRLNGSSTGKSDTLTLPFTVADSRLAFLYQQQKNLNSRQPHLSLNLDQALPHLPIQLVITDAGKGQYYYQLKSLCAGSGNRLEKLLAAAASAKILQSHFSDTSCHPSVASIPEFQNPDGGLSQVRWGSSVLETSAWTALINPRGLNRPQLLKYFQSQSAQAQSDLSQILSAWGRTLISDPQLPTLKLKTQSSPHLETQLHGAIALALAGDTTTAHNIFLDIMANHAYISKPYIRLQPQSTVSPDQSETILKYTSLALYLGSLVDTQFNPGLYAYLRDYRSGIENIPVYLAEIAYIDKVISTLPSSDTKLTLQLSNQTQTIDLRHGHSSTFSLTKTQAQNANLALISGQAEISARYYLGPEALDQIPSDHRFKISRSYTKVKSSQTRVSPGDIVAVNISYDLDPRSPVGCYTITDPIPSGLSLIKDPAVFGLTSSDWVSTDTSGQIRHDFCFSPWWQYHDDKTVTYYLKASVPGDYTAEPAIIQYLSDPSLLQFTPTSRLLIAND